MRFLVVALIAGMVSVATAGAALADVAFPLRVSRSHRFFEDATGAPFLLQGDTAWSLIAELKREDAETYLRDRKARGFNTILVNLIEKRFSSNPPANAYGDRPFAGKAFGRLDPAYFDHAAGVIGEAQKLGLAVFLAPAYLGVNGGDQGWFSEAEAAGPDAMRAYGEAVAQRFAQFRNIVWVMGGDFDAPDRRLVSSLAQGIARGAPGVLQTVHSGRDSNTAEIWRGEPWFGLDTVYSYGDVHAVLAARRQAAAMPVILLESAYEFERDTTARMVRRNAYGALLAGAAGQFFGNNPVWHFTGPGVFTADQSWREALNSPGARSMTVLKRLFDRLPWPQLEPDSENDILADGKGYAAALPDRSLTVIYGEGDDFRVRKSAVRGDRQALWFDPASGGIRQAQPVVVNDGGVLHFTPPPDRPYAQRSDWLLLIGDAARLQPIRKG
ncbi:hypothetical protein FHS76_002728 [Ochrobactrum daejeonense]|uniref:DUF4038 domain-containing protein n=1 Tax=Brucella daejeonensis TaxID=659015 RepID=A0A7W9ELY4_9HYPH|nr:DUF4038 domain-containing protein [Brucella daejeonensis]MBB5702839.1 hypothetical protein [Brucella daejeonensis]